MQQLHCIFFSAIVLLEMKSSLTQLKPQVLTIFPAKMSARVVVIRLIVLEITLTFVCENLYIVQLNV